MKRICPECRTETTARLCPVDGFVTVTVDLFKSQESERLVGTVFEGRYRIDGVLGHGGMGTVYRGTQLNVDRPVGIKLIHAERAQDLISLKRFQLEARLIARLNHPNIIQLIDFGAPDDRYIYLVMELVEGSSLAECRVPGQPMEPARVIRIAEQILEGLAEAHDLGIVHRDLKPSNIMLTTYADQPDFVKILDFGVATNPEETENSPRLTHAGVTVGSPMYMPPEQAAGLEITGNADIYSLGAIMYELVTGRPPFRCQTNREYMTAHVHAPVPAPVIGGREAHGPLIDFILSCLMKSPEARPANARAALELLRACREAPVALGATREEDRASASNPALSAPASLITVDATGVVSGQPRPSRQVTETHPRLESHDDGRDPRPSRGAQGTARATPSQPHRDPRPVMLVASRRRETPWALIVGSLAALVLLGIGILALNPELGAGGQAEPSEEPAVPPAPPALQADTGEGLAPATPARAEPGAAMVADDEQRGSSPPPAAPGAAANAHSVTVTTEPSGAALLANGQALGVTPLAVVWPRGEPAPEVSLSRAGYRAERLQITSDDIRSGLRHVPLVEDQARAEERPAEGSQPTATPEPEPGADPRDR